MSANNGIALNSSVQHPPSDAPSFDGGRNALRSFVPYKACWDGRPCPARLPRVDGPTKAKVSTRAAVFGGERIREVEREAALQRSAPGS